MPSFLSKVFGRKKDDKESPRRVVDTELLDGKFEAVSPSATKFPEVANERQARSREKDSPFNVFRSKSRPSSPEPKDKRAQVPHLSLNLPGLKNEEASRELGFVFEADLDSQVLSEEAIGSRRLNPLETLILVRACSEAIIARGLETLGVMHPHWYSASPEEQRKLISLFLKSLPAKTAITTLSPTPSAIATAFDSEISSNQSPYDVAAVLRWGLRHLQLNGRSFGKDDEWYKTFFDAERSAGWPPNGFTSNLAPLLPTSHLELLTATLELFSSLAAHAEANGISGSKLSKGFGLWLLAVERAQEDDDWSTFYARWERTGRMLEHLFLSRIRDDATASRMPTRLLELVQRYPYQTDTNAELLARPRFSTIQYDALFVRIETELSVTTDQLSHHPLRILSEAFKAEASPDADELAALWESIRKAGADGGSSSPGEYPGLSHVFADETLRFFSLVPVETESRAIGSPSFNLYTEPSSSDKDVTATATAVVTSSSVLRQLKTLVSPVTSSGVNSPIGPDWITFSTSGFSDDLAERPPLASTLMEKERDMEVTIPRPSSPRLSLFNGRKSSDRPRTPAKAEEPKPSPSAVPSPVKAVAKSTHVSLVQLDEAFIDFWSDALLDPISSSWPAFIICKLRNTETEVDGKRIEWLVLEQAFKRPTPPSPPHETSASSHSHESSRRTNTSSPTSIKSDGSFTFGQMFKRFGLFTSPRKMSIPLSQDKEGANVKGKGKEVASPKVGEMGEILRQENEGKGKKGKEVEGKKDQIVRVRVPSPKPKRSVDVSVSRQSVDAVMKKSVDEGNRTNGVVAGSLAAGAAAVVGGVAAVAAAAGASDQPEVVKGEEPVSAPAVEPSKNGAPTDSATSAVPPQEEVPVPEFVKEAILIEETIKDSGAAQDDEASTTVAAAAEPKEVDAVHSETADHSPAEVSEPEITPSAVGEAKAADRGVVSAEECKSTDHDAEPTVEAIKVLEPEVVSAVEEAKVVEHEAAPVVEEVKLTEPEVVPVVEETKVFQPQAAPVVDNAKISETEAVPAIEKVKAFEPTIEDIRSSEPEVVPAAEEARVPEPEIAPVIEEAKGPEPEVTSALEDTKVPQSVAEENKFPAPIVEESRTSEPEVASVIEEAKIPEPETAPETSIEEPLAVFPDVGGKSTPVVESVVEEPAKAVVKEEMPPAAAEVVAAMVTEVTAPTPEKITEEPATAGPAPENNLQEVSIAGKSDGPASEAVALEPVSGNLVAKEESAPIEPEIVKETSPEAVEAVQIYQEEQELATGTVTTEPEPVPSVVESTVGSTRELVTERRPGEPATVVAENTPVVGLKQVETPSAEEAVAGESTPVIGDATENPAPVKAEVVLPTEDQSPAAEGLEVKSISTTSDQPAEESPAVVETGNAAKEEIAPVIEELASSTTETENVIEPTEQEQAVTHSAEHTVPVAETQYAPVEVHTPVELVSADVPQEISVPGHEGSVKVHASQEVASAAGVSTPATVEPKAEAVAVSVEPEPVLIPAEQIVEKNSDIDSKEVLMPTEETRPVVAAEHETSVPSEETIAGGKEPTLSVSEKSEPDVKTRESEPAQVTASETGDNESLSAVAEPAPSAVDKPAESTDSVEPKEETLAPPRGEVEVAPIVGESTLSATEPEVRAAANEESTADEPMKKSADAVEDTPAPATEETPVAVKEPGPEVETSIAPIEAGAVPVAAGHPVEENTEVVNTALTDELSAVEQPQSEVYEVQPTLAATDVSTGESTVTADHMEKIPVPLLKALVAEDLAPVPVVEPDLEPVQTESLPTVAKSLDEIQPTLAVIGTSTGESTVTTEGKTPGPVLEAPDTEDPALAHVVLESKPVQTAPAPTAADHPVEEITAVGNFTETPAVVSIVEEPKPGPEMPVPVEAEPTPTADELAVKTFDIIKPTTNPPPTEEVIVPIVEVPAPSAVVESAPVPTTVEVKSASIAADQSGESTAVSSDQPLVSIEEAAPVVEEPIQPQLQVHEPVKETSAVEIESTEAPISVPTTKEVPDLIAEDDEPSAAELELGMKIHAPIQPASAIAEEYVEKVVPTVEHASAAEVADEVSVKDTVPAEAAIVEGKPTEIKAVEEALAPTAEAVAEPISNEEHETAAPAPTPTGDEPVKGTSAIEIEPTEAPISVPTTKEVSVLIAEDDEPSAAEPAHEVEIHAPTEPASAVADEHVEKIVPTIEHASAAEVADEDTVPAEAIIEGKPKVTTVVGDATESSGPADETINELTSKGDALVVTESRNGHSAAVKEEEEPTQATVPADVPDANATASAKE
ncbi:hypothetical protein H2248_002413 [Termitomyces sp. 'cryptogamus']|nr:hypothetical protein H2248_002413 [Termitomyces sp. 'cryptogamus']